MGKTKGRKWSVGAGGAVSGAILALVVVSTAFGQMPTAEQYMAACAREVVQKADPATVTYLQRRFMVETRNLTDLERARFIRPYCEARFMDFLTGLAR